MKTTVWACLLIGFGLTAAGQPAGQVQPVVVTQDNVFKFYKDFRRLTKAPELLDSNFTDLCRPVVQPYEKAKAGLGPHYRASVHYYANPAAAAALTQKQKSLPEGSVIVKTKQADNWHLEEPGKEPAVSGIGGMIKRKAGYDPVHGDWEYFYADATTPFTTGKLESCVACHTKAKAEDSLFRVRDLAE